MKTAVVSSRSPLQNACAIRHFVSCDPPGHACAQRRAAQLRAAWLGLKARVNRQGASMRGVERPTQNYAERSFCRANQREEGTKWPRVVCERNVHVRGECSSREKTHRGWKMQKGEGFAPTRPSTPEISRPARNPRQISRAR